MPDKYKIKYLQIYLFYLSNILNLHISILKIEATTPFSILLPYLLIMIFSHSINVFLILIFFSVKAFVSKYCALINF